MYEYLIKNSSSLLKTFIMRLIIKKIDIYNLRFTIVELLNMGANDRLIFEYEQLHDNYYLDKLGDANET